VCFTSFSQARSLRCFSVEGVKVSAGPKSDTPANCFNSGGMMFLNGLTNAHYSSHPGMSSSSTSGPTSDRERVISDDSAYSLDARQLAAGLRPGEAKPGTETLSALHKPLPQDRRARMGGTYEHVHSLHQQLPVSPRSVALVVEGQLPVQQQKDGSLAGMVQDRSRGQPCLFNYATPCAHHPLSIGLPP